MNTLKQLLSMNKQYNNYKYSYNDIIKIKEEYCYIAPKELTNELQKPLCTNPRNIIFAYLRDIDRKLFNNYTSLEIERFCYKKNINYQMVIL